MFYRETNFKHTVVGKIPNEWEIVRLGDERLFNIIMGQSPASSTYNKKGEGLPFLQGKMEFGRMYPSPILYCSQPIKIAEQNDVIISVRAPVGDVNVAPYRICIGRGLAAIRFNPEKASHWFYFYYFQKIKNVLQNMGKGSTFKAITKDDLENLKLPYPSFLEQQKITKFLLTVDEAVQKIDEIVATTQRLKRGWMQELLTKGIGHKEFKYTEIGKIPLTWQVVSLDNVCKLRNELVQPSSDNKELFVGLEHLDTGETKLHNFAQSADVKSAKFRFYAGDILYGKLRPYLDKAVIADFNGICSTDLLVLKPKENVLKEFLIYVLHSDDFIKYAMATTTGTNHPRTSWSAISKFKFGLPEYSEQQNIAKILSAVDMKLELEKKELTKLERLKQGLMGLLLTGEIRVKVI